MNTENIWEAWMDINSDIDPLVVIFYSINCIYSTALFVFVV